MRLPVSAPVAAALAAAILFGASTPIAGQLLKGASLFWLAGILYLGSGIGLWLARLLRDRGWRRPQLPLRDWAWLLAAIAVGGVLGPLLLLLGLRQLSAASVSLLLNLEGVLTAGLAALVFREHVGGRVRLGMLLIVAGGVALAWQGEAAGGVRPLGVLAVVGACLAWALDNNLTRKVAAHDALFIAGSKGLVAGSVNCLLGAMAGHAAPDIGQLPLMLLIGFLGYGASLVLFVLALRGLGSARTGAYFSTAPFIGAAVAITVFAETMAPLVLLAALLMAAGVALHLTEVHAHTHRHEAMEHTHSHVHDEHHQHDHAFAWDGREPHSHAHYHAPLTHYHAHYPDIHHQHPHA